MKKILETLKRKWAEYLLEIFVIIIGVLCAFILNNWNQDRINQQIRKDYLVRLQEDFAKDRNDLNFLLKAHMNRASSVQEFQKYFNQKEIESEIFNKLYWSIFHADDFIENDNTFQDLKNNGRLDLISQDQLKWSMLELYHKYKKLNAFEEHIRRDNAEYIYNPTMALVDIDKMDSDNYEVFLSEFLKIVTDHNIKNGFGLFYINSTNLSDQYTSCLMSLDKLDSLIVLELDKY